MAGAPASGGGHDESAPTALIMQRGGDDAPAKEATGTSAEPANADPAAAEQPHARPRDTIATPEEIEEYQRREWPKHREAIRRRQEAFRRTIRSQRARCENLDL